MSWKKLAPFVVFLSCSIIWGSTFLVISIGNDSVPPMWAATIRLVLASAILSLLVIAMRQKFPSGEALKAAFWYGFYEFGVNFALLYWGEQKVASGIAALLYATIPLSAMLFARLFGLEQLNFTKLICAIIALIGITIIFSGELGAGVPFVPFLAVLGAATSAALATVLLKRGPPQPAIASNAVGTGIGAIVCFLASLFMGEPRALPDSWDQWFPIVYLTLAGSVGAFVLFAWLVNRWEASTVGFISVIVPVVAIALGASLRDERIAPLSFVGIALVLLAVILPLWNERQKLSERKAKSE